MLSTLKWLNYAVPERIRGVYGDRSVNMYRQTDYGREKAIGLEEIQDIRNENLSNFTLEERSAFTFYSIYHHLGVLGYNLSDEKTISRIKLVTKISSKILVNFDIDSGKDFLYFGWQESTLGEIDYGEKMISSYD